MAAKDPDRRRRNAVDAVRASWIYTTDRTARTAPATQASPVHIDYWINRLGSERDYKTEADLMAAAETALSLEMQRRGRAGAETRRRNKAAKQQEAARLAASA
ncbi:hypothetical protein FXF51_56945 [Nonomuraea sp. PA05]|uniref:hypothetical protein n=1 Tax=Nonomuraea sp. PA05 TaxID=2604466 RepID=UPI0011D7616A|nr:hypothetical protein [Nonomuraea sp. PA05]TYB50269.1 hypothetical protein FXF51_56945 [Nonomuraea sp. PA05]